MNGEPSVTRHAVIKVEDPEEEFMLLNGMQEDQGCMAIYNSHLSEYGVMADRYYAMASPDTPVLFGRHNSGL